MVNPIIMLIARQAAHLILLVLVMVMQLMTVLWVVDYSLCVMWRDIPFRLSFAKVRFH
jgi:hypothetical protein